MFQDDQWERIEQLLSGKANDRGTTANDNRRFVEAVSGSCAPAVPGAIHPLNSGIGIVRRCVSRVGAKRAPGGGWSLPCVATPTWSTCSSTPRSFVLTSIPRTSKKSGVPRNLSLAQGTDHQVTRGSRYLGQSAARHSDGGPDRRYRSGRALIKDQQANFVVADCGHSKTLKALYRYKNGRIAHIRCKH